MRIFAIGDIHGCSTALDTLLSIIPLQPEDVLITLGDYVDRGPNSKKVIDTLIALKGRCHLVTLKGNHEIMMSEARLNMNALVDWCHCGGSTTLDSYNVRSFEDIPAAHWDFIEKALPYYETDDHFFVHANAASHVELAEQSPDMLFWERFGKPKPHQSGKIMVCGHTPQTSGHPKDVGHAICIDTHVYANGWLTCLEVQSRQYWQAKENGKTRTGSLK